MSDWIEWKGGTCPVPAGTSVDLLFRDGRAVRNKPPAWDWHHTGGNGDIVAYRLAQPAAGPAPDPVNHPPHYTAGGIECIDAIQAALTPEEFRGYCKGNALKYVWRERHKGGAESLAKAQWYLKRMEGGK